MGGGAPGIFRLHRIRHAFSGGRLSYGAIDDLVFFRRLALLEVRQSLLETVFSRLENGGLDPEGRQWGLHVFRALGEPALYGAITGSGLSFRQLGPW